VKNNFEDILRQFLNIYWLRPENGYWTALRSKALSNYEIPSNTIDISCGDGLFSFIHNGGRFDKKFDIFCSTTNLDKVRQEHVDIFDYVDATYHPSIIKKPAKNYALATDWKMSLLKKAEKLNFYNEVLVHDNNKKFPFKDETFDAVYSNSIYWVSKIDLHLDELKRICKKGGKIILEIKTNRIKEFTLEKKFPNFGFKFNHLVGRGRFETWKTFRELDWWLKSFENRCLDILVCQGFIDPIHAYIWDLGLRPIAPALIKMANSVKSEIREEVKSEMLEVYMTLCKPLCEVEVDPKEAIENLIILERR
jgi:SAM-dependent methyltransferase